MAKRTFEIRKRDNSTSYRDPILGFELVLSISTLDPVNELKTMDDLQSAIRAEEPDGVDLPWWVQRIGRSSLELVIERHRSLRHQGDAATDPTSAHAPAFTQQWLDALVETLSLDRYNVEAAESLVELTRHCNRKVVEQAVTAAAGLLRRRFRERMVTRTAAFESLRKALAKFVDTDDVLHFIAAIPYLVHDRPAATLAYCVDLLHSPDSEIRGQVGAALGANREFTPERELLEMVLMDWLSRESDSSLLLQMGRVPLVPICRIPSILRAGLALPAPLLRMRAAIRCAHELDLSTADKLIVEAKHDEPDEIVTKYLDAAMVHLKARQAPRSEGEQLDDSKSDPT
jgi:hypothetical protein